MHWGNIPTSAISILRKALATDASTPTKSKSTASSSTPRTSTCSFCQVNSAPTHVALAVGLPLQTSQNPMNDLLRDKRQESRCWPPNCCKAKCCKWEPAIKFYLHGIPSQRGSGRVVGDLRGCQPWCQASSRLLIANYTGDKHQSPQFTNFDYPSRIAT